MKAETAQLRLLRAIPNSKEISFHWKNNFPGKAMLHVEMRKRTGEYASFDLPWPYRGYPTSKLKKMLLNPANWTQL
jgi:hypothetical protein